MGFRRLSAGLQKPDPLRRIMKVEYVNKVAVIALCMGVASVCGAQTTDGQKPADQTPAPAAAAPLPTPAITGPLQELPPATFEAGPFGKLSANGFLSGMGL